jgi:hypothetical protein
VPVLTSVHACMAIDAAGGGAREVSPSPMRARAPLKAPLQARWGRCGTVPAVSGPTCGDVGRRREFGSPELTPTVMRIGLGN